MSAASLAWSAVARDVGKCGNAGLILLPEIARLGLRHKKAPQDELGGLFLSEAATYCTLILPRISPPGKAALCRLT
jgi:hypothetical protein